MSPPAELLPHHLEALLAVIPLEGSSVPSCTCGPACGAIQYAARLESRWNMDQLTILRQRDELRLLRARLETDGRERALLVAR